MKGLVGEYSFVCNLGGYFDAFDEVETIEEFRNRALERLSNELADLILKRPMSELAEAFTVEVGEVEETEE